MPIELLNDNSLSNNKTCYARVWHIIGKLLKTLLRIKTNSSWSKQSRKEKADRMI